MNGLLLKLAAACMITLLYGVLANAENGMMFGSHSIPLRPSGLLGSALMGDALGKVPPSVPELTAPSTLFFRDVPSISGQYSFGGRTFLPYLGAGFGNGYTSDLDRSLNNTRSMTMDTGLRTQFGQGLAPNEFQMGIRIPF